MSRDTEDLVARAIQRLTDRAAMYAATVPGQVDLKTLLADRQSLSDRIDVLEGALSGLERANERLCEARTEDEYHALIDAGRAPLLLELDEARRSARAALHQEGIATDVGR